MVEISPLWLSPGRDLFSFLRGKLACRRWVVKFVGVSVKVSVALIPREDPREESLH